MKDGKPESYQKSFGLKAAQGVEVTPDILTRINKYALKELSAEEVFVRRYIMAHNAVDRDRERFPETLLEDFVKTLPGKSFLKVHNKQSLPIGLFFDAVTEEMTPEQFKALTNEDARLPDGITTVKVLWGWIYILKAAFNEEITSNIDAGIYRYSSIGFSASDLIPIKGAYDQILYWEYVPPGEATEGSIVWLGAQQGATAQKALDIEKEQKQREQKGGNTEMKEFLKMLQRIFPGKVFTEENLSDEMKDALENHVKTAVDAAVEKATKPLNDKITELTPLAADGKAFRDDLIGKYVSSKAKLKEVAETPEAQEKVKAVASAYPMDFLKTEVDALQKRVDAQFPDKPQTKGDERRDKSAEGDDEKNAFEPDEQEG